MYRFGSAAEGFFDRATWRESLPILGSRWIERRHMDEFATMKKIGRLFGVSSHVIGRHLVALGYRTPNKRPSAKVFQANMVQQKHTFDYANYLWS
jgi:hypothetical protein